MDECDLALERVGNDVEEEVWRTRHGARDAVLEAFRIREKEKEDPAVIFKHMAIRVALFKDNARATALECMLAVYNQQPKRTLFAKKNLAFKVLRLLEVSKEEAKIVSQLFWAMVEGKRYHSSASPHQLAS